MTAYLVFAPGDPLPISFDNFNAALAAAKRRKGARVELSHINRWGEEDVRSVVYADEDAPDTPARRSFWARLRDALRAAWNTRLGPPAVALAVTTWSLAALRAMGVLP